MTEMSDYGIRCSTACTRAGLATLLLSAVAITMLQPLDKTRELDSVLRYLSLRLAMQERLNQLAADLVWKYLKNSPLGHAATKDWPLRQLIKFEVEDDGGSLRAKTIIAPPTSSETKKPEGKTALSLQPSRPPVPTAPPNAPSTVPAPSKVPATPTGPRTSPLTPPAPPSNIKILIERGIEPIRDIASSLVGLGNGKLLSTARNYSNQYNRSIYRWALLRSQLMCRNNPSCVPLFSSSRAVGNLSVGDVTETMVLDYLKFRDIFEMINYEPVRESDLDQLLKEQASLTFPSVGLSITAIRAASLVEMALVLMALYFWLYYREAKQSPNFPAQATLFGVFARTTLSRILFNILLLIPPVAAVFLAQKSFWITPTNVIPAALIVLIGCIIAREGTPRVN